MTILTVFCVVGDVPFLYPMRDTGDYIGSVHFEMRDSNDNLVGVVESDLIYYPAHPIFDKVYQSIQFQEH